ncbi:MAG: hypothetical protein HY811_06865 [Planctomycetes bacterium]|nr:hypothetical protein [Planctomycetota bacterium]
MKAMRKDHDLKEKTVRELKQLWKKDYDLRPATGVILMLALWINAPAASENYWYKLFVGLEEGGEA